MGQLTTNFKGDDIALNYVYPTLENVSVLISGITINPFISVDVNGASAYYYKSTKPGVTEGASGRALTSAESGNSRVDILMARSFQVDDVIPHVVGKALTYNQVGEKMVQAIAAVANGWGKKGIIEMIDGGTIAAGTASTKSTVYGNVIDTIQAFDDANPDKATGANYVMVTNKTLALLRKSDEFVGNTQTGSMLKDGLVGELGGLSVVQAKQLSTVVAGDLDNYTAIAGIEYIVGAADAFAAPTNFKNFRLMESELYFGTKVQAELSFGFDVADSARLHIRVASKTDA